MAMTTEQLGALLEPLDFKRAKSGTHFGRWIGELNAFKDADGDFACFIAVDLAHEGRTVMFVAPGLYDLSKCKHRAAALEACLVMAHCMKSLNYEFNGDTGEVRATVEIPVADSALDENQATRALSLLISVLDAGDPVIRHAMRTGKIDLSREGLKAAEVDRLDREQLVKDLGGIERLRDLARSQGTEQA